MTKQFGKGNTASIIDNSQNNTNDNPSKPSVNYILTGHLTSGENYNPNLHKLSFPDETYDQQVVARNTKDYRNESTFYTPQEINLAKNNLNNQCNICLNALTTQQAENNNIVTCKKGHKFCKGCILQYYNTINPNTNTNIDISTKQINCPTCRYKGNMDTSNNPYSPYGGRRRKSRKARKSRKSRKARKSRKSRKSRK